MIEKANHGHEHGPSHAHGHGHEQSGSCGHGKAKDDCGCHEPEDACANPKSSQQATADGFTVLAPLPQLKQAQANTGKNVGTTVQSGTLFEGTKEYPQGLMIGFDVGSTTVKAVVINPATDEVLWKDYQRHDTKQPEKSLELLQQIEQAFALVPRNAFRVFITGSGGSAIGRHINAKFVQEVNAVSLAVERTYPEVQAVVELGGQDAKIIVFKTEEVSGKKKKIPSMNDKCAGGTGAVIDKINAKLKIPAERLSQMGYTDLKLHPVAGKCGVFAETDINGLQKSGVPETELMASLFEAIVMQNLSVLTRGHTLKPTVLLLGGPNTYIKGMQECWRTNIPAMWKERGVAVPEGKSVEELIIAPRDGQYFAAIGAVEFGKIESADNPDLGVYPGYDMLKWYIDVGRDEEKKSGNGAGGLSKSPDELEAFKKRYAKQPWEPAKFQSGQVVEGFIGIDGGSTSTKCALLDHNKNVIAKAYQLSKGNPIEDTKEVLAALLDQVESQGATLKVLGVGTTGYAKDILKDVIGADVALVETVAHTQAGLHFYPGTDVIVDVGGQDIKLIILKNGAVKDFKLNTQCSAGNGYFLQSTAAGFGYDVKDFADIAFNAKSMPSFGYGCAVFMQSDIVDFQRQGWQAAEIMAGLANVLPKNIWLYVAQIPNLAKLGTKFVLQGGTQHNLAAVKSQVDFIESRFRGTGVTPEVTVHKHCGESGAIGCAIEAHRLYHEQGRRTTFLGFEKIGVISYRTTRNESTRCYFCKNKCLRTFIDVKVDANAPADAPSPRPASKVPLAAGEQRLIISTCEKGSVEDVKDMRAIKGALDEKKKANPNLVEISARRAFESPNVELVADELPKVSPLNFLKRAEIEKRRRLMEKRSSLRVGIARCLNIYSHAPFFLGVLESLGVKHENIIFSDYTSEELYKEGAKRGAIDPCFPSKIGIPHVHNLLHHKHSEKKPLDVIFFPMVDSFPTLLENVQASRACPTVVGTADAAHAAFTKEGDMFAARGIAYKKTFLNIDQPLLAARQFAEDWFDVLGVTEEEARRAVRQGLKALTNFEESMRGIARDVLKTLHAEDRLGVVVLARPYHNDPGVNHEICEELQKLGYPILTQDALPTDPEILEQLFGEEVRAGKFASPLSIEDAWKNSYSENTSRKVWAAKYTARHPNLVALELSSFKCGHDAPIYTTIEEIVENSGTPYFCFKDIDENKPTGSIKIRIETIGYFLERYRQKMVAEKHKRAEIEFKLLELEAKLRGREEVGSAG